MDKVLHDEASVRRLVARSDDPRPLRACYEAGPTGYELQRLLADMRVRCDVVAPSLIPKAPGDRVKTDRRDARRPARLHRAGELVAIRVPSEAEQAARDLCRARADMVEDRNRARQRLGIEPSPLLFERLRGPPPPGRSPSAAGWWPGTAPASLPRTPRPTPRRSAAAAPDIPPLRLLTLLECGTHALLGAVFDGYGRASQLFTARANAR